MTITRGVILLLLGCYLTTAQVYQPRVREDYEQKQYKPPLQGLNMCAFKEVVEPNGEVTKAWTCGLPEDGKSGKVVYDCCPGFKRSPIVDNKCVEVEATYDPIISTLRRLNKDVIADSLLPAEPKLDQDEPEEDFTVFVPEKDGSFPDKSTGAMKSIIADGRHYSQDFRDGVSIPNKNGPPLKVSTGPNNLVFIECQMLTKPDLETSNGLIQTTSGPIESTDRYPTVMQRLQSEPSIRKFVSDIPSDVRQQLESRGSNKRYTIFAPEDKAWDEAKKHVSGQGVGDLVREHIVDNLVCGRSIDPIERPVGPTKAGSFLRGVQNPDGSRILKDSCGSSVQIRQMDKMAGNGVVHVLDRSLQGTESLDFQAALKCIAQNGDSDISRAAEEMSRCNINVRQNENAVVLLPTKEAMSGMGQSSPCQVYSHHVLTSRDCQMKNGNGVGAPQECLYQSKYTAPNGDKPTVTNQYIRERDGSKLHFGNAQTTTLKPISFRDGVIYPVKSVNKPPTKRIMEMIAEDPELQTTYNNMQKSGMASIIQQRSPNVMFLAPQNHGWKTRNKEKAYGPGQMRKLLEMHTIPHQMLTGKDGTISPETIQTIDSLSPSMKLKVKQTLGGSTFVGHEQMPPDHWSMAVGEPRIGTDGVLWPVDWPMVCNNC